MISLFMHGGPSHIDLFDPKPELTRRSGQDYAGEVTFSFVDRASKKLFGSPWKFEKHGQSGIEVSELLPHFASAARITRLSTDPNRGMAGRTVQGLIDVLESNYGGDVSKMPYVVNKEAF